VTSVVTAAGTSVTTLGTPVGEADGLLGRLVSDGVPAALAARNPHLWGPDAVPTARRGLGWLDAPAGSRALLPRIAGLRERFGDCDRVILAGTGDATRAAQVVSQKISVLDTTDPHQVARVLAGSLDRTVAVLAGADDALETDAHRRILDAAFHAAGLDPATRIVTVADPETSPRYGALSACGLVPAALAGADAGALLEQADELSQSFAHPYRSPGLTLGAALGAAALAGRDKLVLRAGDPASAALAGWIEQLVAASLGKDGKGILPVVAGVGDGPAEPDELRVSLHVAPPARAATEPQSRSPTTPSVHEPSGVEADLAVSGPLGAQFLLWEYATAVAGRLIGVNPFDQPGVAEAEHTAAALLRGSEDGVAPTVIARAPAFVDGPVEVYGPADLLKGVKDLDGAIEAFVRVIPDEGYLAVMAYLDAIGDAPAALLRSSLATRTRGRPVTFGWGPRCLHGAGQFHKGGRQVGTFLQITGAVTTDVAVPGRPYSMKSLQLAQAFGDHRLLASLGRPVLRLHLRDRTTGLQRLRRVFSPLASGAL
jgi:glucose-6-phosphate isomerase